MANPMFWGWSSFPRSLRAPAQCLTACAVLALLTYAGFVLQINLLTISLLYLLIVVAAASFFGFWQASLTSLVAVLLLDYFFEPPVLSFEVESPGIFVALVTFEVTALTISRFHGREMSVASEAAIQRTEMEQLHELSRSLLLLDMRRPLGLQLAVLIHRIFGARAVALFDMNLGRQDRAGEWGVGEEDLARECYLCAADQDNSQTETAQRILRAGSGSVGALVVRGRLSPIVIDALASLAAIAIDWQQGFENEDRAETAMRGEQLRAAVLDALAHEFKTPLAAVQTASSGLLELGGLTDSQADLVTLIDNETVRLNQLCTRLLQTAKLNPKHIDLETVDVNVEELVSEVLAVRFAGVERDRVQVAVDYPGLIVRADRGLLAMILAQYIDNAGKYSAPNTPIKISIQTSHDEALISVHNFGPTIRIEDRERIFDRFYRSPEMKDFAPGTGIGLSVAKKAAEAHHGHVWVISDGKEGTTFFLSLPKSVRRKH
jgi:two-component system sensor histidine kinase KdpD